MSDDKAMQFFSTIPNGYKPCVEYAWDGKQSCKQVAALIADWSKAIKVCGSDIESRTKKYELPESEATSTLKVAVDSLKASLQTFALKMQEACAIMEKDRDAFVEMRHAQSNSKREAQKTYETSRKALEKAQSHMNSAKRSYDSACRKAEKAIAQRDDAKSGRDPKLAAKLDKFTATANKEINKAKDLESRYSDSVNEVRKHQVEFRNTTFKVLNDLQNLEVQRIKVTTAMIDLCVKEHLKMASLMTANFETTAKKISEISHARDLDGFIAKAKTESKLSSVPPLVLESYVHHRNPTLEREGIRQTFHAQDEVKAPLPAAPSPNGGTKKQDLNDFLGKGPRPPTSPPGGIQKPPGPPGGPAAASKPPKPPGAVAPQAEKKAPKPSGPRPVVARAEYEFTAEEDNDLGFKIGDYIMVTSREDAEWWTGKNMSSGKTGDFPANYVTIVQDPVNGKVKQAKALFDYEEGEEGDLGFKKDDLIDVLDDSDPGWWEGLIDGRTGRFPSNYTSLI
uniref:SH3 domain-containing protein n=3 Tax=Lotharella globosa TaxID=91324 RepID=A0A7S3YK69_9EUKA|eukprot:CAMPEP_0167791934 /NCGR_PEP_ID=MMETSP0111_2-20121227/12255_1 /TAXON_ID=91324 /ORGANISM="Lotharella globosa, Strain CCCM811" /LENGTH=508 /DNA_ID=CAMNT_0007684745 /DNA_START=59 /DNA_END=1585 /DNA_ORIENTATION=+